MRLRSYRWLLVIVLIVGGYKAYEAHPAWRQWLRHHQFRNNGLDYALPRQVYLLDTDRWLKFDVPKETPLIRLISNASVSADKQASPGTEWPYAIEYQFEGAQNQTNATGIYHFKGEQLAYLDTQSGEPVEVNSYLDRRFSPLGGRRCMFNLDDPAITNARVLRLRLYSSHPDLREVAVRVYYQTKVPERKTGYLWNRLSEDQKRDLARGNVYSVEGLTEREKRGLLRYRWSAAAPEGIPGQDFERRILYIRDDSERMQMLKDWVPLGVPVNAEHRGVVPITNAPGVPVIELLDHASNSTTHVVSSTLVLHAERHPVEIGQPIWTGTNQTHLASGSEGLLEVGSSRPVYVRAFQAHREETNEITPEPVRLLEFTVSSTNSIEYAVHHTGQESTLFRLDLRRFCPSSACSALAPGRIRYALIAENEAVVQAGDVLLTNAFSPYDWLVTTNGLTNITVAQSLCFELPSAVRALRIFSPGETVYVNAYSRPAQLAKRMLVPEDYSPGRWLTPEQPSWFTVRPADHRQRCEAGQCAFVRVQASVPEYDPLIQSGQYVWESFLPATESRGQMILLPPAGDQTQRPDSIAFSYFPVDVGRVQRVRLQGEAWERVVTPSLILVSTNGSPGAATVTIDGRSVLDSSLETPVTQIRLGSLTVGQHQVKVTANRSISAYLNYLKFATNAALIQRFCIMASSNVLHFPYFKRQAGEEMLVLTVFSPWETNPAPFQVHLKLIPGTPRGIGPFSSLTLLERQAQVTPSPTGDSHLVAALPAQLDDGQPLFLQVGPDVPPGQHELEVSIAADSPRWLSLSRTTPGQVEKLEIASKHRGD